MPYLYLMITVLLNASGSILGAFYNRKNKEEADAHFYNFLLISSIFLCWVILFLLDGTYDWRVLPYALLFSIGFAAGSMFLIQALRSGPVVLTSLILQLSLIVTTIWGFFFWDVEATWIIGIGLILVVVSLWLCLYEGKENKQKINLKWLFFALICFLGNACCTIVQKTQQMHFNGKYGNFTMMIATAIAAFVSFFVYLKNGKHNKKLLKKSWHFPVLAGSMNAMLNLFVILLATTELSPSLIYPVLSIGSLIVTTMFSACIFKEKMHWWQWIGIGLGIVAIALLS